MDLIFLGIDFNSIMARRYQTSQYSKTIKLVKQFDFANHDLKRIIIDLPWTVETFQKILINLGFKNLEWSNLGNSSERKIIISAPTNLIGGQEKIFTTSKDERWSTLVKKIKEEIDSGFQLDKQKLLGTIFEWIEDNGYRNDKFKPRENYELKEKVKVAFYLSSTSDIYFELIREMIRELGWSLSQTIFIPNLYFLTKNFLDRNKNVAVILIDNNFFEVNVIVDGFWQPIWSWRIEQITDLSRKIIDYLSVLEREQNGLLPAISGKIFFRGCYTESEIKNKIVAPLIQSGYFLDFSLQTIHSAKQNIKGQVINDLSLHYV